MGRISILEVWVEINSRSRVRKAQGVCRKQRSWKLSWNGVFSWWRGSKKAGDMVWGTLTVR